MPKFCPRCGTETSDKVKFCTSCGVDINSSSIKLENKSIVDENKESAKFWYNKGVDFAESEEYENALMAYDKALTFDTKDPDIWINRCYILNLLSRYEEAVIAGEMAVKLSPQDTQILHNLHDAYIGSNNLEKASDCSKKIIDINYSTLYDEDGSSRNFVDFNFSNIFKKAKQPFSLTILFMMIISSIIALFIAIFISSWSADSLLIGTVIRAVIVFIIFVAVFTILLRLLQPITDPKYVIIIGIIVFLIIFFYPLYLEVQNPLFDPNNYVYTSYPIYHVTQGQINLFVMFKIEQFVLCAIFIVPVVSLSYACAYFTKER